MTSVEVKEMVDEEGTDEEDGIRDLEDQFGSSLTMDKVAAAKQFIEDHYKSQRRHIQDRKQRRLMLERQLSDLGKPQEKRASLMRELEHKETVYMRHKRQKFRVDDFILLTIIGRGAFGEVRLCREKKSGNIYAMKKLKKSEMLSRGQVIQELITLHSS